MKEITEQGIRGLVDTEKTRIEVINALKESEVKNNRKIQELKRDNSRMNREIKDLNGAIRELNSVRDGNVRETSFELT